jgi:isocitrate dehydrogenase kinase/phosphatase
VSGNAKQRFEEADWQGQHRCIRERIQYYDDRVRECVDRLHNEFHADSLDDNTWQQAKLLYIGLLVNHQQPELAETFFNSVTTKILHRQYFHNDFIFVRPAISTELIESSPPTWRSYYPNQSGLRAAVKTIFTDFGWSGPLPTSIVMSTTSCEPRCRISVVNGPSAKRISSCRCSVRPTTATRLPT